MTRRIALRLHAAKRMVHRRIRMAEVEQALAEGEVIEEYPEDEPFPSRLILGWIAGRPLHIVAADDAEGDVTHVVTAYEPDPERWDDGFRKRKP